RSAMSITFAELLLWFTSQRFFIPGSLTIAIGRDKGDVLKDKEGMDRAQEFGEGVAFLLKKLSTS
ncbi:flavodoxin family protein, partial [Chloroflexota bacterium]